MRLIIVVVSVTIISFALSACRPSENRNPTRSPAASPAPSAVGAGNHHLDCGAENIYINNTGQPQRVIVTASNNCEFTAYLWITFSSGHVISKDLKRGDTFSDTVRLPPGGSVEFWCSMVSTIENRGCEFNVNPL